MRRRAAIRSNLGSRKRKKKALIEQGFFTSSEDGLITVGVGLERTFERHTDIIGLIVAKHG
jgi:hypothetical protein